MCMFQMIYKHPEINRKLFLYCISVNCFGCTYMYVTIEHAEYKCRIQTAWNSGARMQLSTSQLLHMRELYSRMASQVDDCSSTA